MHKIFYIYRYLSRIILFFCLIALFSYNSFSQVRGEFKSITSGNWNDASTWQMFDGSTWKDTTTTPGALNSVFIGYDHLVTLTQDESCHDLNLHTGPGQHRITLGSYTLIVSGKLRAYTGAAPGASTTATPIVPYWINTSGGGKILIIGNSRYITNTGEWGAGAPGWRLEIALTAGETGIFNTSIKAAHIVIKSGTMLFTGDNSIYPDSGVYGTGTLTILYSATLCMKAGTIQRQLYAGTSSHFARLDLNGTLTFDSTVVGAIGSGIINFNGTVAYTADGSQTFATRGANTGATNPGTYTNIDLNGSGTKILGLNTTIKGKLKLAGSAAFSLGSYTRTYGSSSTLEYAGSANQITTDAELPSSGAAPNLVVNNSNGVTLHDSRTVSGLLDLTSGTISTGSNILSIGSLGSVNRTSGHVAGKLQKHIAAGSPVVNFEIGDANNYTPVELSLSGVTTEGDVTAETVTGDHPEISSSMIDDGNSVNRYWTIGNSGVNFSTCDAVFNFASSDVDVGATPADFSAAKYEAPNWTAVNVGTKTSTSTEVKELTSFSDFAIGKIKSYTITATAGSNGSIAPSGAVSVQYGGNQQFIITPDDGYHLSSLYVDNIHADTSASYTFSNVTQDHSIDAAFSINTYSLTVNATNGTVTKDPDQGLYNHGTSVQLVPVPAVGYHFVNWSGDASGTDNPLNVIMNGPKTITANFALIVYNITSSSGSNGLITPAGVIPVSHGGSQNFVIAANEGYVIEDVTVDGNSVGAVPNYEFTNVTTDHTIYAAFSPAGFLVEFNVMDNWNLISVPVKRDDYDKTALFPSAVSDAFAYNGMYEICDTLTNGAGYWLKFEGDQPISISGAQRDNDTIEVNAGWNLIGSLSDDIGITSVIPLGTTIESYFFIYKNGYEVADSVKVGSGLWIKVSNPGGLVMSAAGAENNFSRNASSELGAMEVLNNIRVTDEASNSRILYFGRKPNQEFSTGLYELPPAPPAGSFDARFTDNRFLATFEELGKNISEFPINIQTAHWPVTLSWEVETNHVMKYILEYTSKGRLKKIDLAGNRDKITLSEAEGSSVKIKVISVTLPKDYTIEQNYPNPFNPSTKIQFGLPVASVVSLKIFNILGQEVATLIDRQMMDAGYGEVEFNGDNLSTGIYFMNFTADGVGQEGNAGHFTSVKKMIYGK